MLAEPRHGWTEFTFGNFTCTPSYLTDVPVDMLACTFSFLLSGTGQCYFDCEGRSYVFVLSVDGVYVICEENKLFVKDITPNDYFLTNYGSIFANEIIEDIEKYIDGWINWEPYVADPQHRKEQLQNSIENLKIWLKMHKEVL